MQWVGQFEDWRESHSYKLTDNKLIRLFAEHLYEKGKAYSTIKVAVTWAKRYLGWVSETQPVATQLRFEIPKKAHPETYCASEEDIIRIQKCCNSSISAPYGYAIALLAYTGMRDSEIISLRNDDWRFVKDSNGTQRVSFSLTQTKNGKPREVPLLMSGHALFKEYVTKVRPKLINGAESDWLFPQQKNPNKPILRKNVEFYMRKLRKDLGKDKLTCHSLRRYYVTKLMDAGKQAETVAKIIGHSNMNNFSRYYKPTAEHLAAALGDL